MSCARRRTIRAAAVALDGCTMWHAADIDARRDGCGLHGAHARLRRACRNDSYCILEDHGWSTSTVHCAVICHVDVWCRVEDGRKCK